MKTAEILTRVFRSDITESIHRGHIAAVHSQGQLLSWLGCPETLIFARSAAKPLQAIPVMESGASEQFGLTENEIAVICASHNGEEEHTAAVASILDKLGQSVHDLTCGIHDPYHKTTTNKMRVNHILPTPLHNNCSGKHSGMLALARALGLSVHHYASPDHPVQQQMLQTIADMSQTPAQQIKIGVDGCGVPVFGLPLVKLALAYARFGDPTDLPDERKKACQKIIRALRAYPAMIAGKDRFDTQLIEATNGRIIGKMGAEGVFALAVPESSIGIAVKVEDGSLRGLYPAVLEVLRQMELITPKQLEQMEAFYRPAVLNRREETVGHIEPDFTLHR